MRKELLAAGLCALLLAGCQDNPKGDNYGGASHLHPDNRRSEVYGDRGNKKRPDESQRFGYYRHQKSPIMGDKSEMAVLDRGQIAKDISRVCTTLPNVNDAAVLVTDEEVLVAYDTDTTNRELTADQVKRTALSRVPRFFHVYISDNKNLMRDVETLTSLTTQNKNADESITAVIREMKKSPQGARVNALENENGETPGDRSGGMSGTNGGMNGGSNGGMNR
ncbi:sporulation protein [Neobacillus piezotolerans]|uniref:Sporulation protein n=1 Tax=Neobacillus piezotolerans TaxID=2259171 RepID=A0A3D8GRN4_9BACI|nr:YhcN/YlaJ family sporulation lipoprotein [Neobacillus piezotolerans]RDU36931.1 sporulation protein [Neobacillus piezotolerans]